MKKDTKPLHFVCGYAILYPRYVRKDCDLEHWIELILELLLRDKHKPDEPPTETEIPARFTVRMSSAYLWGCVIVCGLLAIVMPFACLGNGIGMMFLFGVPLVVLMGVSLWLWRHKVVVDEEALRISTLVRKKKIPWQEIDGACLIRYSDKNEVTLALYRGKTFLLDADSAHTNFWTLLAMVKKKEIPIREETDLPLQRLLHPD